MYLSMWIEAKPDRKECPPAVDSDTAATAPDEKPTAVAEPPEAKADGSFLMGDNVVKMGEVWSCCFFFWSSNDF